jgi:hypothetical protein
MNKPPRVVYLDSKREQNNCLFYCNTCRMHDTCEIPNKYNREDYLYCGYCGSKDTVAFYDVYWEEDPRAAHSKKSHIVYQRHFKKR